MPAEQSPEESGKPSFEQILRNLDRARQELRLEVPSLPEDGFLMQELAAIYQSEGWEKAEEYLTRGCHG